MNFNLGLTLGFLLIYILLAGYVRSSCWNDPTSKFFQADLAHVPKYSAHRIQQAIRYADHMTTEPQTQGSKTITPELCVGVASVERDGISYLKLTIGSLQHGLSVDERTRLNFVVLLAHTNQTQHPDYDQPWLARMIDRLPSYHDDPERLTLARIMESNQTHGTKAKFDYSIVMEECEKTGASYILMIEDDVVFLDGWRHRTMQALDTAALKTWELGHTDFLYLRLFYYEGLLGWNAESWPLYLGSSLAATAAVICLVLLTRRFIPAMRPYLSRSVLVIITLAFMPLLIALFFAAGANCILPQPEGVHLMSENACCGQGLVFPRSTVVNDLLPLFRHKRWNKVPTDSFIEEYADKTGALRWALSPVVMQHVGGQSSHGVARGDLYGNLSPSRIWNFGFEDSDAQSLTAEHLRMDE
ncbi:hypothetical protein F5Y19DRAFT_463027 [Xylariaceae sp. FL1651]|nr:hypothetical protein F5Y19DRAFT_463027 [Xylariaceae sp. FL1651]